MWVEKYYLKFKQGYKIIMQCVETYATLKNSQELKTGKDQSIQRHNFGDVVCYEIRQKWVEKIPVQSYYPITGIAPKMQ